MQGRADQHAWRTRWLDGYHPQQALARVEPSHRRKLIYGAYCRDRPRRQQSVRHGIGVLQRRSHRRHPGTPNKPLTAVSEALALSVRQSRWRPLQPPASVPPRLGRCGQSLRHADSGSDGRRRRPFQHEPQRAARARGQDSGRRASGFLEHSVGAHGRRSRRGVSHCLGADMCQSALALLAAGAQDAPLLFPAVSQLSDSRFPQKLFINGAPWLNDEKQLDEDSFPSFPRTTCARRVYCSSSTRGMVLAAADVLITNGPMTVQERWDDQEVYSPSTLASNIPSLHA